MIFVLQSLNTPENLSFIETQINSNIAFYESAKIDNPYVVTPAFKIALKKISNEIYDIGEPCFKQILKGILEPDKRRKEAVLEEALMVLAETPNSALLCAILEHIRKSKTMYSNTLKEIGLFFYLNVGPSFYEFVSKNLSLPGTTTVKNFLYSEFEGIIEGELRINQCAAWLERRHLSKNVWISEDATAIVRKVFFIMRP